MCGLGVVATICPTPMESRAARRGCVHGSRGIDGGGRAGSPGGLGARGRSGIRPGIRRTGWFTSGGAWPFARQDIVELQACRKEAAQHEQGGEQEAFHFDARSFVQSPSKVTTQWISAASGPR